MTDQIQTEEMTYEKLSEEVKKLLDNTEEKMIDLIDEYNLSIENKQYEYENEIDTVDLSMKFRELSDYIEDYSQTKNIREKISISFELATAIYEYLCPNRSLMYLNCIIPEIDTPSV